MASMGNEERDAFLRETRIASLVTLGEGGSPVVVPVWFEWDGEVARIFTSKSAAKMSRVANDARVALSVHEPVGKREAWVTIEGTAAIEEGDPMPLIRRLTGRYYDAERARVTLKEWEAGAANWAILRITPSRIRSLSPS
jgi:PPOX class probable F420-dependent enzyme